MRKMISAISISQYVPRDIRANSRKRDLLLYLYIFLIINLFNFPLNCDICALLIFCDNYLLHLELFCS